MTRPGATTPPARRPVVAPRGAPGAKLLISALALAATLVGWARLAGARPVASFVTRRTAWLAESGSAASAAVVQYQVSPLPTLVPLIASAPAARRAPVRPAAAVSDAAPALPDVATLRMVSAPPPEPVAVTQSSR